MNAPYTRIFISVLFASFGLTSCADPSPQECPLTPVDCQNVGKILDAVTCACSETSSQSCQLTPVDCQNVGKILDTGKCVCMDISASAECNFGSQMLQLGETTCDEEGRVVLCQTDGTMSEGTWCTEGICKDGRCARRDCEGIADGQNICRNNTLMVCDDGELIEDFSNACGDDMPLCRDGHAECSDYHDCGTIRHTQIGCKENNIVLCQDGKTSVVEGGDCVSESKSCFADASSDIGFVCKTATPTDCQWKDGLLAQDQTVCDGNVLRKCSEEIDGTLSPGVDCADNDDGKIYCDPTLNQCRTYRDCVENGDIPHGAVVCNSKGTNKAQCQDGRLVNLSGADACPIVENASTVCTFTTEAECTYSCNKGYVQIKNACQRIASCNPYKEVYDSESNSCTCDNANHWVGTVGSCRCENGYLQIGGQCEAQKSCDATKEVYDSESNTCTCDNANHWVGTVGSCTCENGYVQIGGQCKAQKTCDATKEIYDAKTNTCTCDNANHWVGMVGSCTCENGYLQIGWQCELKKACDASKEVYDSESNSCTCDNANHWVGTAGSCVCETGYVAVGGQCEVKKSCDAVTEIYEAVSNTCACDAAKHWTGTTGSCTCETGYLLIGGQCEAQKSCDAVTEIYDVVTNTCACDNANHWVGTAGSCTCETSYVAVGGQCEVKKSCDAVTETYDAVSNTCACDNANHWVGTAGSCTCETGYELSGTVCNRSISVGDIVTFGHYEQDNDTDNGKEPIEWRVLDINEEGQLLLLSDKALDVQRYNTTVISITWEKSTIRSWLNGYEASYNTVGKDYTAENFIDAAFTAEEKAKILTSNVPAHENPKYSTSPGNPTTDKIFLLSIVEAQTYFATDADRKADATRYAVKKGLFVDGSETGSSFNGTCSDVHCISCWWLRSPGSRTDYAAHVFFHGSIGGGGFNVRDNNDNAVRPALWVSF